MQSQNNNTVVTTNNQEVKNMDWKNITVADILSNATIGAMMLDSGESDVHSARIIKNAVKGRMTKIASMGEIDYSEVLNVCTPFGALGIQHGVTDDEQRKVAFKLFPSPSNGVATINATTGESEEEITFTNEGYVTYLNMYEGQFASDNGFDSFFELVDETIKIGQRKAENHDFMVNTYKGGNYLMIFQAKPGSVKEKATKNQEHYTVLAAEIYMIEAGAESVNAIGLERQTRTTVKPARNVKKHASAASLMASLAPENVSLPEAPVSDVDVLNLMA